MTMDRDALKEAKQEYERWLNAPEVDEATKEELRAIAGDEEELAERFSHRMTFGTSGMRGVMKAGIFTMNRYMVRYATEALSRILLRETSSREKERPSVVLAFDSRYHSREYAHDAAAVLAAHDIEVYLWEELRPTPELSFAVRETGSAAGINITASHNTYEYNGYKVYGPDGAQLSPAGTDALAAEMDKLDLFRDVTYLSEEELTESPLVHILDEEMDEAYLEAVYAQSVGREYVEDVAEEMRIIYTPLHGAGRLLAPEMLRRIGIHHLVTVEEQMEPDGDFPTVHTPNPESDDGFRLAKEYGARERADLLLATDPDSDRCGVMVRDPETDEYVRLTGNECGCLLLDYLIREHRRRGDLPENAAAVESIVSSRLFAVIAKKNDIALAEVFTGFKFIGAKIREFEESGEHRFLFGYEESIGFLAGTYARDKDGILASMLIAEMACYYRGLGMNLLEALEELYARYGYYTEETVSTMFDSVDAAQEMTERMAKLREQTAAFTSEGIEVADYLEGARHRRDAAGAQIREELQPQGSNVLRYAFPDGSYVAVRPSGTEPKIKMYILAHGNSAEAADARAAELKAWGKEILCF